MCMLLSAQYGFGRRNKNCKNETTLKRRLSVISKCMWNALNLVLKMFL